MRGWIVRPPAQGDIDVAAAWYEQQQAGLGPRFLQMLDRVLLRICETPQQFPVVAVDVRRALLPTFPYAVYFRETEQTIVVLAVLHLRRNPGIWRGRQR